MSFVSSIRLLEERMETWLLCCAFPGVTFFLAHHVILFVKVQARLQHALMRLPHERLINFG